MKACAAIAGIIVGLAIVVVCGIYIVPRFQAGSGAAAVPHSDFPPKSGSSSGPGERIETPPSETERMKKEIERKRIPYFRMIHDKFSDKIVRASVLDDIDTLDLVVKKGDTETLQWIVQNAVGPTAREYGFERVRFYVANPLSKTEPYTIVAESSWDGSTRWNTFLK
jgi:hypothetical protein